MEEYEDELLEFFSREADNVKDKLCSKRTGKPRPLASCAGGPALTAQDGAPHSDLMDAPPLASTPFALGVGVIFLQSLPISFQIRVSVRLGTGERAAGITGHL